MRDEESKEAMQHLGDWTVQMLDHPQLSARGFFVEIDHPYAGTLKYPTMAFQFKTTDGKEPQRLPAPLLG